MPQFLVDLTFHISLVWGMYELAKEIRNLVMRVAHLRNELQNARVAGKDGGLVTE